MPTSQPFVDEPTDAHEMSRRRVIDDWTAGDEPDFVVRPRRRRIAGDEHVSAPVDHAVPPHHAGDHAAPARRRSIVLEGDVEERRHVDSWIDDDLDMLSRPRETAIDEHGGAAYPAPVVEADTAVGIAYDDDDDADAAVVDLVDALPADAVASTGLPMEPAERASDRDEDRPAGIRAAGGRRTVAIKGRPDVLAQAPRLREIERRRPARTPSERVGSRPDRIALWAVGLSFALILIAALTAG